MTDMNDKMDNDVSTKIAVDIILDEGDISWRDLPIWSTTPYMKYYSLYGVLKQI